MKIIETTFCDDNVDNVLFSRDIYIELLPRTSGTASRIEDLEDVGNITIIILNIPKQLESI
jgi:hypothetical protein